VTGAGTYNPATSTAFSFTQTWVTLLVYFSYFIFFYASFVEPNGMGITNTIGRAELAAITASFLHSHSLIATVASRLFTKSGNNCFTLSFTATISKEIF